MPDLGSNPRQFIRHNLLTLSPFLDDPSPALVRFDGTVWVTLKDVTEDYKTVRRNRNRRWLARLMPRSYETWWKKATTIYEVAPASDDLDRFAAYICPYRANATRFQMLAANARVMFTGDMDGCTFGVGIPSPNGDVRVGHANAQDQATGHQFAPNFKPQRTAQQEALAARGTAQLLVDPDVYREGPPEGKEFKAVTIGLRVGNAWEFYYQHQVVDGSDLREKVATTKLQ